MKTVIVFLLVSISSQFAFSLQPDSTFGQPVSQVSSQQKYYGKEFYSSVLPNLREDALKESLKRILKSGHIRSDGSFDVIVPTCQGQSNCRMQISLGYNKARSFLLGGFYLVKEGKDYGVQEMYCDRVYHSQEFRNEPPGPGIVPDNTVVNIEHTWPQSRFSGRYPKDIQKADLHHLYPTDSQMNSLRGNILFGEVSRDSQKTKCHASKHGTGTAGNREIFEPPQNHKGHVARALFYFSIRYDLPIDSKEEVVLKKWHREHPVDEIEVMRNNEIYKAQGNRNPFIDHPELVSGISDF